MPRCTLVLGIGLVFGASGMLGAAETKQSPTPPWRGFFGMKGMMGPGALQDVWGDLLRSEAVRNELRITPDQLDQIKNIARKASEIARRNFEEMQRLRDAAPDERKKLFAEISKQARLQAGATRAELERALRTDQLARLKQLALQLQGAAALDDKEIQDELKLSEEQKKELRLLRENVVQTMRQWASPGFAGEETAEARRKRFRALLGERDAKALGVLTEEQKARFEEMKGRPFDLSQVRSPRDVSLKPSKREWDRLPKP